jgi:hypothetical protein
LNQLLLVVMNIPVYAFIGYTIYGDLSEFLSQLGGWIGRVFSIEFFDGALFPPFRIQLRIYSSVAVTYGEYRLLMKG